MTDKQIAFCREYVKDWNATQAATRAGYSAKTAYSQGQRLLKDAEVRAELSKLTADIADQNDVEVREIIAGLRSIAFAPEDARVNNSDRIRALELLGKYKAIFTERREHSVRPYGPPPDPQERKKWLEEELRLIEEAEETGPALAV
jgi:phage terminase small subunit